MSSSNFLNFTIRRDDYGRKLGNALARGSLTIVQGNEGSGKSVFGERLAFGLLENKHSVSYVSTDYSTRDFIKIMKSLDYGVVKYLLNKQLLFMPVFPTTATLTPQANLLERLVHSSELFDNDIVIVDSLNRLVGTRKLTDNDLFDFVTFLKRLAGIEKTLFVTFDPLGFPPALKELLEEIADNFVVLDVKNVQGDLKNVAMIKRWTKGEVEVTKVISYRVEPKIGLIIDISSFAG
jgi:archaeal flagellar protein FlaH